jgi:hypothetical protein
MEAPGQDLSGEARTQTRVSLDRREHTARANSKRRCHRRDEPGYQICVVADLDALGYAAGNTLVTTFRGYLGNLGARRLTLAGPVLLH